MITQDIASIWISGLTSSKVWDFLCAMKDTGIIRNIPNISWNTAKYLIETLQKKQPKNILEIGPANGFSTMMLAIGSPSSHITSIECSRHAFEELRHNIDIFTILSHRPQESDDIMAETLTPAHLPPKTTSDINQIILDQLTLYYADAREILPAFVAGQSEIVCTHPSSTLHDIPVQKFDFIFIDGAFRMTQDFFDLSVPLLNPGGMIIIDDAIKYRWKME